MVRITTLLGSLLLASTMACAMDGPTDPTEMYSYLKSRFPYLNEEIFGDVYLDCGGDYHSMVRILNRKKDDLPMNPNPFGSQNAFASAFSSSPPSPHIYPSFPSPSNTTSIMTSTPWSGGHMPSPYAPTIMTTTPYDATTSMSSPYPSTVSLSSPHSSSFSLNSPLPSCQSSSSWEPSILDLHKGEFKKDEFPPVIQLIYDELHRKYEEEVNYSLDHDIPLPQFPSNDGLSDVPTPEFYQLSFVKILQQFDKKLMELKSRYAEKNEEFVHIKMMVMQINERGESDLRDASSANDANRILGFLSHSNENYNVLLGLLTQLKLDINNLERDRGYLICHIKELASQEHKEKEKKELASQEHNGKEKKEKK